MFLESFLNKDGGVPSEGSDLVWENCAKMLNKYCGTNMTGKTLSYLKCSLLLDMFAI